MCETSSKTCINPNDETTMHVITTPRFYFFTTLVVVLLLVIFYSFSGITTPEPVELDLKTTDLEWITPTDNFTRPKLFNVTFKYVLEPDPCPVHDILAVIIVTSHRNNIETRSAMRRAFSQNDLRNLKLHRVFLLGETPDSIYMSQASVLNENKRFRDLIQGNFIEDYRNLTYKHVMGLQWVSDYCKNAKYVIKMDDDIVVDILKITQMISNFTLPENSVGGYVFRNMKPIREPANKWFVTIEEYRFSKYPSFVSGWFYITTPSIASKLSLLSHYFKYFWIDDVYVTGIMAMSLRLKHYDLRKYFTVHPEFLQCCINDVRKNLDCDILVGPNGGDNDLFYEFNEALKTCRTSKCGIRKNSLNETCVAERKVNLKGGSSFIEKYNLH